MAEHPVPTAHVAIFEGLIDSEIGHLLVELRSGRFTGVRFNVITVADGPEPITTMGGLHVIPAMLLSDLEPPASDLLVLAGGEMWDTGGGQAHATAASRFLDAGVPVAAICGATAGLARAGLLDDRNHTSSAADYLQATGYAGGQRYLEERAVVEGALITAGPQSPVQFARAVLGRLGLMSDQTLQAYEDLFHGGNQAALPVLMQAAQGIS
jgi:putative intracellular protease/amidase